tara:strand:- start:71 stop:331 length:261 start_codon:yes stop_codon:yes gene_type:complete
MPTYSYQCEVCSDVIDVFQKMSDSALKKSICNKCNKETKVKRIIKGGSGMIFKGSGFYLTDYTDYGKSAKSAKKDLKENNNKKKKD